MYQFFKPDIKELNQLVGKTLAKQGEKVLASEVLQTGWTNITMNVHGQKDEYIFRFPRTQFFANAMIKDCQACHFLKDKISLPLPQMRLLMDQNRPFSMHPKIKGQTLDKIVPDLSASERQAIADELALFLVELQKIPLAKAPRIMKKKLNHFLIDLAAVHNGNYDLNRHALWEKTERETPALYLSHGDFHPGNILIGADKKVAGIIDFAFITVSDRHADLGRFVSRSDPGMSQDLIRSYQRQTQMPCDMDRIHQMADLFHYVDRKYVQYMQRAHPEIVIPKMLLQPSK